MATMKEICNLILTWNTSGTNSRHDPAFISFKTKFKNALTAELKKINATNIVFNYGHYYISGFFTVNEQAYYFSLPDVRYWSECNLLWRTAKNYIDYHGGINQYAHLESGMFINIRQFS